jgi:hypothetical protein
VKEISYSGWSKTPNVGVLDTGVSRSTCSWATSTAQLRPGSKMKTEAQQRRPSEEAPHEENDDNTAKDQKTSSRGVPREGRNKIYASLAHSSVVREDNIRRWRTVHVSPTRERPAPAVPA